MQAIDDAFSVDGVAAFLEALRVRGARICSLEEVSSVLTDYLPAAAYSRGETFDTSFVSLHSKLGRIEQDRVQEHYDSQIISVPEALRKRFASVFRG
jgi:hypothetical protein